MCQSSLYLWLRRYFFQNARFSLAQRTWPRALCYAWWNNCPFLRFVRLHFFQPNMVQLDQSCGEKTWRTRSSGWGYKMKASIWTHWSVFPLSNKAAYRILSVKFDVCFLVISGIIQSHDSHGLSSSGQRGVCILPSWNTYTTYFSMSILGSFSHWRWSNFTLQVFKYAVGWLHLSLVLLCNYKKSLASSSSISVSCFVQAFFACISHPTFIGDLVPASLIVESCFKTSLSVGTTVTKSDTAAWYKNNNPTTRIFWTFQIECYGVETCWHWHMFFWNLSKLGKKSFLYNDKTM